MKKDDIVNVNWVAFNKWYAKRIGGESSYDISRPVKVVEVFEDKVHVSQKMTDNPNELQSVFSAIPRKFIIG